MGVAGALDVFAAEVGDTDPVAPVGGRTHWDIGGVVDPAARPVRAPAGIVAHQPEEMIVRVRAGTTVAELDAALAERGQIVLLDPPDPGRATVGGVLAVGQSGLRRLRWGPVRDTVLELRFVSAEGRVVKAGGPVVKNVTGFDLCRLLVGSLGTLGVLAEAVLRVQPQPPVRRWLQAVADPFAARRALHQPSSVLWDGTTTWVLLEGHGADVDAEARALGSGWHEVGGPPPLPGSHRQSLPPGQLRHLTGTFLAEVGVGIVHRPGPPASAPAAPAGHAPPVAALQSRLKTLFDPTGRCNPGRWVP